jgi:uncharacterized YigZ family protein
MNAERYRTVQGYGAKEIVIRKSRFIGHAAPVASDEEAYRFIESIRKQHAQATHNCYAYVAGERDQFQKFSDDGEPGGTAGKPILEVIKHRRLRNVAVVVTRYFGGILLGAGGLVRAYTDGAVAAIDAAGPVEMVLREHVHVAVDYTWYGKLENELRHRGTRMGETAFTDKVVLHCLPAVSEAEAFVAWLTDLTQGQAAITRGEREYLPEPIAEP